MDHQFKGYVLLLAILVCAGPSIAQKRGKLTPELLWKLGRGSLEDVSPDGRTVLYGVTRYALEANEGQRDLYLIAADGSDKGRPRRLTYTPASEANARFHPDGERIGYLYQRHLWVMDLATQQAYQVSDIEMEGFAWSPDGEKVLYVAEVPYEPTVAERYPDLPQADAYIFDDLMYRHWDRYEDGKYRNIFVATFADSTLSDVRNIMNEAYDAPMQPFGGMEQIAWHPKGHLIAYTCKKRKGKAYATSTNSEIYLYNLFTGQTRNISEGLAGYDVEPAFSPDGRYLAWNSMATDGYESDRNRIFILDLRNGSRWEMTEGLDMNAHHPRWATDGSGIYFSSEWGGTHHIWYVNFRKGGKLRQLTSGHYNYYDFIVCPDYLIARRCSMSEPHELYRVTLDAGRAHQLTFTNEEMLDTIAMGKVEKRWIRTTDGKHMLTWVIYPPSFDPEKKYPTLLYCQGGPQSTVSQFWSYRWNFQLMAANDYIVVAPNRRGLPGFGREWNDAIAGDWGGQAMQDLLAAIDSMSREPFVDADRLGAVGASFGGYSVYWLAGNHQGRFKAFVAHAGLFHLESWYGTTEELFFANHDLQGPYWQEPRPKTYDTDSPHLYADKWDTPILIIHGGKDYRVPLSEGIQAFQVAQLKGIPSRFLYYPDENHWILSPQNSILWHRVFFEWLDQWLKE